MLQKNDHLKPRKTPTQGRSRYTVDVIHQATIQVLLAEGAESLTTTKVAARAGVSVGTLYQYFGDKTSLLSSVTERHLLQVADAIEISCTEQQGKSLATMSDNLIESFFSAKFAEPETSRALYSIASRVEGNDMAMKLLQRSQQQICQMLSSASDIELTDPITTTFVLTSIMMGPVQTLLTINAPAPFCEKIKGELKLMVKTYLATIGISKNKVLNKSAT